MVMLLCQARRLVAGRCHGGRSKAVKGVFVVVKRRRMSGRIGGVGSGYHAVWVTVPTNA